MFCIYNLCADKCPYSEKLVQKCQGAFSITKPESILVKNVLLLVKGALWFDHGYLSGLISKLMFVTVALC